MARLAVLAFVLALLAGCAHSVPVSPGERASAASAPHLLGHSVLQPACVFLCFGTGQTSVGSEGAQLHGGAITKDRTTSIGSGNRGAAKRPPAAGAKP